MSILGETWGRHIVVNDSAKSVRVRTFLKNIDCLAALKAVCHGHGLWYREDPDSGIIYIVTLDEFTQGDAFSEKKFVEVVTLTYPRCEDIAAAIQEAYRDMVIYMAPDQDDDDDIGDISRALERMDELADRSTILEGNGSSTRASSRSSGRGRTSSRRSSQSQRGMENVLRYYDDIERIGPRNTQVEFMPKAAPSPAGEARRDDAPRTLRPSMVFASIVRRSNSIVLRSSDREMLNQIRETIRQLDIPRAQVLLEVRILQLDVSDAQDRELGFLLNGSSHTYGSFEGGFSKSLSVRDIAYNVTGSHTDGDYTHTLSSGTTRDELGALSIAESALYPNHSVFQLLNKHYSLRLNLLDSKGKVRALATPSLLVADYEASRIFLGTTRYVQTGFTAGTSLISGTGTGSQSATTADFEERNIGTALVITPKVHADGTVTLRIMQENSTAQEERAVSTSAGTFYETPIKRETITSSIVAKDGETIALGGLMQHEESDTLYKIPWLGDIPYFGALFRHTAHSASDYELVVLIKPTVVLTPGAAGRASRGFLRDNLQDRRNLHEAMDRTREQRRANADKALATPDSEGTNSLVNAALDFEWLPTRERAGKRESHD
ncbi:MAG: type II secretion system protein GspD [Kiritimatiellia bacterium]